jgi:5-methylcytosine-specific restriction protein A
VIGTIPMLFLNQRAEWRTVSGFPDYEISDDGRLRRRTAGSNSRQGHEIRPRINQRGYPQYGLSAPDGRRATFCAHRLVALQFLDPPEPTKTLVLHRNDNQFDARATNLRWGSALDNAADARQNERYHLGDNHPSRRSPWIRRRGERHPKAKLDEAQVRQIFASSAGQRDLAARFGVDKALIWRIQNGQVWRHITNPEYAAMLAARELTPTFVRRRRLTTRQRQELLDRENHACHLCNGRIRPGDAWDVSHEIALELGGADDEKNRRAAHRKCHREHTAKSDIPAIAKLKRVRAKHTGAFQSANPMPGGRNSPFKKKMNGQVVMR